MLVAAAAVPALFTVVNTRINPLWVSPAPWTDEGYAEFRPIHNHQRTGKAGILDARPWKVVLAGSSRIDIAMDPALPEWGDKPAVNLAVSAGSLPETAAIVRRALRRAPVETAIVGIDIGDLLSAESQWRMTGFMESPFNPQADPLEQTLRHYAGISTFESAVQAVINRRSHQPAEYTPQGHRLRHQETGDVAMVIRRDAIAHALRTVRARKANPPADANPWKLGCLRQILDDTKAAGCRLVLVIPPSHATYLAVFFHENDPDPAFSRDRRIMAGAVAASNAAHPGAPPAEIWDFNDFHPLNAEAIPMDGTRMHYWLDGTHARRALGNLMLARIMGWPAAADAGDYGFKLDVSNLGDRERAIREGCARLRRENPEMWTWMEEGIGQYQRSDAGSTESIVAPAF